MIFKNFQLEILWSHEFSLPKCWRTQIPNHSLSTSSPDVGVVDITKHYVWLPYWLCFYSHWLLFIRGTLKESGCILVPSHIIQEWLTSTTLWRKSVLSVKVDDPWQLWSSQVPRAKSLPDFSISLTPHSVSNLISPYPNPYWFYLWPPVALKVA